MSLSDLLPLLPLLVLTVTAVIAMLAVGVKRHYGLTATLSVLGLLVAAFLAAMMMGYTNQQITPLLLIDQFSLFFTLLCCGSALMLVVIGFPYFFRLDDHREEYLLLLLVATIGAVVLISSNHFVSFLLGLETLSMALYGMVAYPIHSKSSVKYPLEAAVKYLVLSAAASAMLLFGMALIYAHTGSLAFVTLVGTDGGLGQGVLLLAITLVLTGIAFKLSLAPFHLWTPDVYEGAPLPATAYLATVGKLAVFVALIRWVVDSRILEMAPVIQLLSLLAVVSILLGNLLALRQSNLKRLLAYSSIAHMGYLLVAVVAGGESEGGFSLEAASFYLVAYVLTSLGAFGVASVLSSSEKENDAVSDYTGLFWRAPGFALILTVMMLSLAGIPLTAGFIGKFYVFFAGVESNLWVLLLVVVAGSGIGLYYYLRVIYQMLQPVAEGATAQLHDGGIESLSAYAALGAVLLLVLLLGLYPAPMIALVELFSTVV